MDTQETEATLLVRAFNTETGDLPKEAARVLLRAKLPEADLRRMEELGRQAQQGRLTPAKRREAEASIHLRTDGVTTSNGTDHS